MQRSALVSTFRTSRVFDAALPYLWSDPEVLEYLDDAINEACERALLIRDQTTAAVCEVPVVAGTHTYTLHASVIEVIRAKLDASTLTLELSSTAAMDDVPPRRYSAGRVLTSGPAWSLYGVNWEATEGVPRALVIDPQGSGLAARLVPKPTANGTLRLHVYRRPLALISAGTDATVPEIPAHLHIRLLDWMEHRAYGKRDAETLDEPKAAAAAARFTEAFGERIDANVRRQQRDRAPSVVRFREY